MSKSVRDSEKRIVPETAVRFETGMKLYDTERDERVKVTFIDEHPTDEAGNVGVYEAEIAVVPVDSSYGNGRSFFLTENNGRYVPLSE